MKIAIVIDQDLPIDEEGITEYINQYSGDVELQVTSVRRANYGIGADWMVALTEIQILIEATAAVYAFFRLPYTVQQFPKQLQAWKDLITEVRSFFSYVENKYTIASYPFQAVIVEAVDHLLYQNPDATKIELHSFCEVGTYHGGLIQYPATYDNSCLLYYSCAFKIEFKNRTIASFQIWDSQKRLVSLANVNWDPRMGRMENQDIRHEMEK